MGTYEGEQAMDITGGGQASMVRRAVALVVCLAIAGVAVACHGPVHEASSSMAAFSGTSPSSMIDGNLSTYWQSNRAPVAGDWVKLDRGAVLALGKVDLYMTAPNNPNDRIQNGVVESSVDGTSWTELGTFSSVNEVHLTAPVGASARYVRARATTANSTFWVVVREFSATANRVTTTTTTPPTGFPIDDRYRSPGGRAVSQTLITDSVGLTHTVFHPTVLGVSPAGFKHPILIWGNGTDNSDPTPNRYTETLTHLASWGYVVVAAHSGQTGYGTEMVRGLDAIQAMNATADNVFYGQLDTAKVGSVGHSQGATGAVNAMVKSGGRVMSTAAVAFVDAVWFNAAQMPPWSQVTKPVHFFWGSSDFLCGESAQTNYYNGVPGPAAKASIKGGDHNVIQQADNQMLGYVTAWFKYTIEGDSFARGAFVVTDGVAPEISRNTAVWERQAQKGLA